MRPIHIWIAISAVAIAAMALLQEALLPFFAGAAIAYLLDPIASRLEQIGLNRLAAALTIFSFILFVMVAFIILVGPVVVDEIYFLFDRAPSYLHRLQSIATDPARPWITRLVGDGLGRAEQALANVSSVAASWLDTFIRSAWSGGQELISVLSVVVVIPVVACYFIIDWRKLTAFADRCIPPEHRETVRQMACEIDQKVAAYVVGQSMLCALLAVFYACALEIIGLNHGIIVGVGAGLVSFIPYLGSLLGLIVAVIIALAQWSPDWISVLQVPLVFFIGQTVADYVLSPYLIGRRVELGPVWVIFSLFACGKIFGFVGLLIAVPAAAAAGVVFRFIFQQVLTSYRQ